MCVVERPIRHRCAGRTGAEHIRCFEHEHQRQVATVAPAPYAHPRRIDERLRREPARALDLVGDFDVADVVVNGGLKRRASRGRAAVIKLKDHVTGACQDLGEGTAGPAIDDALHVGSAVDVNNGGITLCRIEMAGLEHLIVQQLAVR